jgi:hypothetical protein
MLESRYLKGLSKIRKCRHKKRHHKWCPGPESNRYAYSAQDFKSCVSTNFTTRAYLILEAGVGIEPAFTELQSAA